MSKRLPYEIALSAALLLGSCNDRVRLNASEAYDLADVANANARNALAKNEEQESDIDDLEQEVSELESKVSSLESTVAQNARISNENARLMDDRWEAYKRHTH